MTRYVLRNVKRKHKLWKKWKECDDDTAHVKYKRQANKASKAAKLSKREFERKIARTIKLEMWANAQHDSRPAEYRWRPLFNAAKFG